MFIMRSWHALLLILFLPVSTVFAQSEPQNILNQLKSKPLFLRGCWHGDDLAFAHDGTAAEHYAPWSFTLSGIDVEKAYFRGDYLEIQGHRVGLEFERNGTPHRVQLKWMGHSGKVTVRIFGQPGDDFGPALHAIFAPDLPTLLPAPQTYWKAVGDRYVQEVSANTQAETDAGVPASDPAPANKTAESRAKHIGSGVKPPVLLSQLNPGYSDAARGLSYSARVEVYMWVEPSGRPSHLTIVRPAGLGLDENALAAAAQYRFKPATKDGVPVKVDLYVDVNFQTY